MRRYVRFLSAGVLGAVLMGSSGCALTGPALPAAAAAAPVAAYSWIAQAAGSHLAVRNAPDGPVMTRLANPNSYGDPLTMLAIAQNGDWLQVALPIRPNGSTGWVRKSAVQLMWVGYRIEVSITQHQLVLYYAGRPVFSTAVAVGSPSTPTPRGTFYLTALLRQPRPDGPYGPYAYGLSGFSPVLKHFAGGPGRIGLHGTNDSASIGRSVTHGCIRVPNSVVRMLASRLPLGTPVDVRA